MSETVVIGKERLVELHVMRSAIVFNPDTADLWDCVVESRFKAEREASKNAILGFSIAAASTSLLDRRWRWTESKSTEYLTVCRSIAGIGVGVRKIGVSSAFAASISPPFSASPAPTLGFSSLLCKVLFSDALVTLVVRVVSISTVSAFRGVWVVLGFPRREDPVGASDVCLNRVWIRDAERLSKAVEVEATCFFSDATLELRNRDVVDECKLGLDPISECILRERICEQDD